MGHNDHIEETPLFWLIDDKRVCVHCFLDPGLRKWFFAQLPIDLVKDNCDYCGTYGSLVTVERLQQHILNFFDLTELDQFSPRNDGEWLVQGVTSEDWMHENIVGKLEDEIVNDFFCNAIDQLYGNYYWQLRSDSEQWMDCWELYCGHVYENNREFLISFSFDEDDYLTPDMVHPAELPERACIALLRADAFSIIPKNTILHRVRKGHHDLTFEELTSAPDQDAGSNRFSLKSESMFYAASDAKTAALEIGLGGKDAYSVGTFKTTKDLVLLDLPRMQLLDGRFDPNWQGNEHIAKFLLRFRADVSKPISEEDKERDYVPTQAFCRYIKEQGASDIAKHYGNHPANEDLPAPIELIEKRLRIDGIRYHSSKDGEECVVLFCDRAGSRECLTLDDARHDIFTPSLLTP
jgi:hypothetical protein